MEACLNQAFPLLLFPSISVHTQVQLAFLDPSTLAWGSSMTFWQGLVILSHSPKWQELTFLSIW